MRECRRAFCRPKRTPPLQGDFVTPHYGVLRSTTFPQSSWRSPRGKEAACGRRDTTCSPARATARSFPPVLSTSAIDIAKCYRAEMHRSRISDRPVQLQVRPSLHRKRRTSKAIVRCSAWMPCYARPPAAYSTVPWHGDFSAPAASHISHQNIAHGLLTVTQVSKNVRRVNPPVHEPARHAYMLLPVGQNAITSCFVTLRFRQSAPTHQHLDILAFQLLQAFARDHPKVGHCVTGCALDLVTRCGTCSRGPDIATHLGAGITGNHV